MLKIYRSEKQKIAPDNFLLKDIQVDDWILEIYSENILAVYHIHSLAEDLKNTLTTFDISRRGRIPRCKYCGKIIPNVMLAEIANEWIRYHET